MIKYLLTNSYDASDIIRSYKAIFSKEKKGWIIDKDNFSSLLNDIKEWKINNMYGGKLRKLEKMVINEIEVEETKKQTTILDLI